MRQRNALRRALRKKYFGISADEIVVKAKAGDYRVRLSFSESKTFAEADFPKPEEFWAEKNSDDCFILIAKKFSP